MSPRLLEVGRVRGKVSSLLCSDQGGGSGDCGQTGPGPGTRPLAVRAKNANIIFFRLRQIYIFVESSFLRLHSLLKSVNSVNILLDNVFSSVS